MKQFLKKSFLLSLIFALTLMGCSSSRITDKLEAVIAVRLILVGFPLVYGVMAIEGEINYHKYYTNQDYMIGKEYELTQDAFLYLGSKGERFLYHDSKGKKLGGRYVESQSYVDVVPSCTRLTVTYVYVYRANVEMGSHAHEVLAKFFLKDQEICANISTLFACDCVYRNPDENFIANPSIMIEVVDCSES